MHIRKFFLLATILCSVCSLNAQRHEQLLETGWKFHKGEANGARQFECLQVFSIL